MRRRQVGRPVLGLLVGVLAVSGGVSVGAAPAGAQGLYGIDTCLYGNVWRDATSNDHVCVSWDRRNEVANENGLAGNRHLSGSDWCVDGFVWREATSDDHACVSPQSRDVVQNENNTAWERRAIDTFYYNWSKYQSSSIEGNLSLELAYNGTYTFKGTAHNRSRWAIDYAAVCAVPTLDGRLMTISHTGTIKGTFVSTFVGNKWQDWNDTGVSAEIVNHWQAIAPGTTPHCQVSTNTSVGSIIDSIQKADAAGEAAVKVVGWIAAA